MYSIRAYNFLGLLSIFDYKLLLSFPFPFVPLQRWGCLVAPLFLWIVLVPCAGDWPSNRGDYDQVSKRDRLGLTPDLTTRWATENYNFVYSSLWHFKRSFTCRKILRHRTFSLYFPSERKVCCGFLSPLKIHRLGRVLNLQPLGPVAGPPRRHTLVHEIISSNIRKVCC
jgi:hypothetical protein